ncbi:pentapeptide repeat-containing protein [Streptomyces sp. NPDC048845]|uniref:pentapeptide repeat-containing protein n=1 Tax=Streptomyces sp. NPDC048845 TaxID=3155390 RepID=UPI00341352A3
MDPYEQCLAHLSETDRSTYLALLAPGSDIDHRGTHFNGLLVDVLLDAMRDPLTGNPRIGSAQFSGATFSGAARFQDATFSAEAYFENAAFHTLACFQDANFRNHARFSGATFSNGARFDGTVFSTESRFVLATFSAQVLFKGAVFSGEAIFTSATFDAKAWFVDAVFSAKARFQGATFLADVWFHGATFAADAEFGVARFSTLAVYAKAAFSTDASFAGARFESAKQLGPLVCGGTLDLSEAQFGCPLTIVAAARKVVCQRTRWGATAVLRLRYATVDLSDAVVEYPLSIASRLPSRPVRGDRTLDESPLAGRDTGVRIVSLSGIDAAHLILTDVDLTECQFSGTIHLDHLRLEGNCTFTLTPAGLHWQGRRPIRWTPRRTLAEEHHWRAARGAVGWTPAPAHMDPPGPRTLAPVYRQLRKAFEDGKNEPDAADFYYGEMEMRRHDTARPRAERALLAMYWAISGYGLRASRALGWLLLAMAATVLAMMLWGLPKDDPKPKSAGTLDGQRITMTTDTPDPVNPDEPYRERLSTERFEKSLLVVINSVVFRSSGQELTTVGTYTEMVSRISEPVLLGLAALAIRGRVKR